MSGPASLLEFARLGVATVYEASGQRGLIDLPLHQIAPGSRVAGPARTVLCAQNDNLMVHAVMALAQPGEVLVIAMPEPEAVGVVGELLATQALGRGVAGMLIDAAVRDCEELRDLGVPIWSRFVRARGATRTVRGSLGQPVTLGGTTIRNGDLIVMDADGAVVVPVERLDEVLEAAQAREVRERGLRSRFEADELSIDVYGLRADLEDLLG
jgi:4-hydroxy-4-methyl-2-oxoglutarate aldolase